MTTELSEYQEQALVIKWWKSFCATKGIEEHLLFSIGNGAHLAGNVARRCAQANKLKSAGLRVGAPDLMLAKPRKTYSGMFIEMKRMSGKASDEQLSFAGMLKRTGYHCTIAHGFDEARLAILDYLN